MPSIQSFQLTVNPLNDHGTFSDRDTMAGNVSLVLLKETTVESLFIKLKGDADVRWTRRHNDRTYTYSASRRFFKLKDFLIPEQPKDTVLPQGTHHYKFSFHIPPGNFPSSFRGNHGKIVYRLEVRLARSWRMDRTLEQEINFVSKAYPNLPSLMLPQAASTNKEMGFFSKGSVHMEATMDRQAYAPGETMMVMAKINNSSSSEMTPKFSLIQDVVYRSSCGNTKHESNVILKAVDNCIKAKTQKEVQCAIKIPVGLKHTIQNCEILSVEYHLKAYLDISFAYDPEIVFKLVICPPDLVSGILHGGAAYNSPSRASGGQGNSTLPPPTAPTGPYPAGPYWGASNSDFAFRQMGPYPASSYSGGYGYPGAQRYSPTPMSSNYPPVNSGTPSVYPAQAAHTPGVHANPQPNTGSPYGSAFSSSSMLHPPPAAPTFPSSPSAPEIQPPPPSAPSPTPQYEVSPSAPTYNLLPSTSMMNTNFLSQSDEAPPAYSLLFPSSTPEQSDVKK